MSDYISSSEVSLPYRDRAAEAKASDCLFAYALGFSRGLCGEVLTRSSLLVVESGFGVQEPETCYAVLVWRRAIGNGTWSDIMDYCDELWLRTKIQSMTQKKAELSRRYACSCIANAAKANFSNRRFDFAKK